MNRLKKYFVDVFICEASEVFSDPLYTPEMILEYLLRQPDYLIFGLGVAMSIGRGDFECPDLAAAELRHRYSSPLYRASVEDSTPAFFMAMHIFGRHEFIVEDLETYLELCE